MVTRKFPARSWPRRRARSHGRSRHGLARVSDAFMFDRRCSKSSSMSSALPKKLQLELLAQFQILPEDLDHLDSERFGVIQREGKKLYRYRAKDYRIYFAKTDEGIKVHRVLHKNTFRDFLFRTKLPVSEDAQLREKPEFWELIEEGERTRKG